MPSVLWHHIQQLLQRSDIPAWLLYDFRGSNSFAAYLLGLPKEKLCTRRWAVLVPAVGRPQKLVHRVEPHVLQAVDAEERLYTTYHEWQVVLAEWCQKYRRIAVEYSPDAALPVVSILDAGTAELLRKLGAELVSSADLLQELVAVYTPEQLEQQARTAQQLYEILWEALAWLRNQLRQGAQPQEYALQQFLLEQLVQSGLETDHPPIVARTERAANPHYSPTEEDSAPIRPGDLVLIDLWAKLRDPSALYADITWMAYAGEEVPPRFAEVFTVLCRARDRAVQLVRDVLAQSRFPAGYEVDRHVRSIVQSAGYGELFLHRTGHSLGTEVHGPGANLDDYETHDTRRLLPGSAFTVEPGLYFPNEFGMRTEINVQIQHNRSVRVCPEPVQQHIVALLSSEWKTQI
ncbi:MAG: M24 family metallopeptidase [Candidatus Kapabacteria bacterium]|nr:M24 family metallopeptidase [Candidatus Kapabacteria bacterium]MCS7169626.1 M24 family metallopeptidase [Candidatus Kapabacteria bacterium]MDW7996551.1 M24 family metallopeptidase [Bacteroidota bacterium]MDW8224967.1 M24 family metallopeptidase [Bacteroidota bacterium]